MGIPVAMQKLQPKDLYGLSDALQLELVIRAVDTINGEANRSLAIPGLSVKVALKLVVVSSRTSYGVTGVVMDTGLLLHLRGDLYMLALHDRTENEIHVWVLDGSKGQDKMEEFFERKVTVTLAALVNELSSTCAVASFFRSVHDKDWKSPSSLL
jgi:hypothetical protein